MLLQAAIDACLETLENFRIGFLDLSITLWMSNGRIADLDVKILIVFLKRATGELRPVVGDDPVGDLEPAVDGLDKLDCGLHVDLDHMGCFRPLGELVDSDVQIPESSDGSGERTQDVQPQHGKRPRGRDHLQRLRRCVDLLGIKLVRLTSLYQLDGILKGCRPVEVMLKDFIDQRISLSHMNDPLSGYLFIKNDVVFEVVPNLCDSCIGPT
jgi:hypothetical protein